MKMVLKQYIESDTFYRDFMVTLICRLSGNLIYHVFSMKTPDNFRTNFTIIFTIKSPKKVSLSTLSANNLNTKHSGNKIYHVFSIKHIEKTNFSSVSLIVALVAVLLVITPLLRTKEST